MLIVPATVKHFRAIRAQAAQAEQVRIASDDHLAILIHEGAQAVIDDAGVWFIGGAVDMGEGRGDCFSVVAGDAGAARFLIVHRMVRAFMDRKAQEYRRLELRADLRVPNSERWAELLGFTRECLLRRYFRDGDAVLYARTQPCPG